MLSREPYELTDLDVGETGKVKPYLVVSLVQNACAQAQLGFSPDGHVLSVHRLH